ncbi:hypothetical protein BZG35_03875 [Brevundimonas sp. LM2]|uniref:glycosyltransferase family 2 protein n=1 Tax=Brevundimonas sp. LM2 TaxID=1938605 RepID=UPI000983D75E|nr:glycosyltransferase family 2 protein [Brevundimonas sp. LM2]AQR60887.1 hypothetical protein BZG35_03875 [Brevundimonas sp. LM2]
MFMHQPAAERGNSRVDVAKKKTLALDKSAVTSAASKREAVESRQSLSRVRALLKDGEPRAALALLDAIADENRALEIATLRGTAFLQLGRFAEAEALFEGERKKGSVPLELDLAHGRVMDRIGRTDESIRLIELALADYRADHLGFDKVYGEAIVELAGYCVRVEDYARAMSVLARQSLTGQPPYEFCLVQFQAAVGLNDPDQLRFAATALCAHPDVTRQQITSVCIELHQQGQFETLQKIASAIQAGQKPLMEVTGFLMSAGLPALLAADKGLDATSVERSIAVVNTWISHPRIRAVALFQLAWLGRESLDAKRLADLMFQVSAAGLDPDKDLAYILNKFLNEVRERLGLSLKDDMETSWWTDRQRAAQTLALWTRLLSQADEPVMALFGLSIALSATPENPGMVFAFAQLLAHVGEISAARQLFARTGCISGNDVPALIWPPSWPEHVLDTAPYDALLPSGVNWPRISVVIPTFNQGEYIEETILSILNQNYSDVEIIVIDAVSTDNTPEILERYRHRFTHLISEPDKGQSDAINKGFALVTGDLVTWLNSDDMFGPGALHMWALEWLRTKADLLFGICVAHRRKIPALVNKPRVKQEDFTPNVLANIGEYWLKGHFFYQPELVFTRELLNRVGGNVNSDNYYCMDYELFMQFAKAGLKIQGVPWPTALFRHHDKQKTAHLDRCVREQGNVRDKYVPDILSSERSDDIIGRLANFSKIGSPRVLVVTTRMDKIFSPRTASEVSSSFSALGVTCHFSDSVDPEVWLNYDAVILLVHLWPSERRALQSLSHRQRRPILVGWYWDNHHIYMDNLETSGLLDISVPGHAFAGAYLRSRNSALWPAVPLCVTQWTREEAGQLEPLMTPADRRSKDLYGGFVRYPDAVERNKRLDSLIESGLVPSIFTIDPHKLDKYFTLSASERFANWSSHATSLSLPFDQDLSQRFFDAWLTGQVPVVTPDMLDIATTQGISDRVGYDLVVSKDASPEAVHAAGLEAAKLFETGGEAGVRRRHLMAKDGHMLVHRLITIVERMKAAGLAGSTQPPVGVVK